MVFRMWETASGGGSFGRSLREVSLKELIAGQSTNERIKMFRFIRTMK